MTFGHVCAITPASASASGYANGIINVPLHLLGQDNIKNGVQYDLFVTGIVCDAAGIVNETTASLR